MQDMLKPANLCSHILLNQINNILDSCKMKFKTLKVVKEEVDLREVSATVKLLLEKKAQAKNIALNVNIDDGIP